MRWCLLLLLGAVVVLGAEVEEQEVDTHERAERADLPPPSRPLRRPGSSAGFSSFLSGLLGSVTKTANVAACPGKCIHALASLMCDTVLEEVQCPTSNMRCCVEKSGGSPPNRDSSIPGLGLSMPPRPSGSPPRKDESEEKEATTENVEEETTKKKKRRKKKDRTTTTTTPSTTTKTEAVSTTDETEDDDETSNTSMSTSNTSMSTPSTSISLLLA